VRVEHGEYLGRYGRTLLRFPAILNGCPMRLGRGLWLEEIPAAGEVELDAQALAELDA
jgi:hypothetical protein